MTDERHVTIDLAYQDWTGEELHAYFAAVGANAIVASAKIDDALNADFRSLIVANMDGDEMPDELVAVPGWQPLNLLGIDPSWVLGFAWIPARREQPDLAFAEFERELRAGDLMDAYVDAVLAGLPQQSEVEAVAEAGDAPLDETSPTPGPTSPNSRTRSSSPTSSSRRSAKSAPSGTTSSRP